MCSFVGGQRLGTHRRQQMLPHQIESGLHIGQATGDRNYRVLVGQDDAVLPERAIAAVGAVATSPELITVALLPVAFGVASVGGLPLSRSIDPFLAQDSFAVPNAFL
jgi:hypothetical protein